MVDCRHPRRQLRAVRRAVQRAGALWVASGLGLTLAQTVTQYDEEGQIFRGQMQAAAHGPDLFGDRVSLYTGGLEFFQQDVSLPGNNSLPVAIGRRYGSGFSRAVGGSGHFGDWELEIPRISVVMATKSNWRLDVMPASEQSRRCSYLGWPELPTVMSNGGAYLPTVPVVQMYVPGVGEQELLVRSSTYADAPADGNTYPLVTRSGWQLRCLPQLAGGSPLAGEGFIARAPDGTTYRFDWMASRTALPLSVPAPQNQLQASRPGITFGRGRQPPLARVRPGNAAPQGAWSVQRSEYWLLPTLVTDRFGNSVTYSYSSSVPWQLQSIQASDGRRLTVGGGALISSVSDGSRTWTYQYASDKLVAVQQPDGGRWQFQGDSLQLKPSAVNFSGEMTSCGRIGPPTAFMSSLVLTRTMIHPSGAIGQFSTREIANGRSFVGYCAPGWSYPPQVYFLSRALASKTLSGPGLPAQTWTYTYPAGDGGYQPCNGCTDRKTVQVTDPLGQVSLHVFGTRWMDNEGLLLATHEGWSNGSALRSTAYRYRAYGAGPYAAANGWSSALARGDLDMQVRNQPQDQRVVTQQGVNFAWEAVQYDSRERPTRITRSGPSGSRTDVHTYFDHPALWVLGQKASVSDAASGLVAEQHQYDPGSAAHTAAYAFGRLTASWDYHADGTLWHAYDPAGRATTFGNYKRGLAQNIGYADGAGESADVNDIGLIVRHTNPAGSTRYFGYDAIGRLAQIIQPSGDPVAYHPTTLAFQASAQAAYELPAGHWKQTVVTGNHITERYFDALWRVRLMRSWDAANPAATRSVVQTRYDVNGRKTFQSTPQRDIAGIDTTVPGTWREYDALGRVWRQQQSSELGWLITTSAYLNGFTKQLVNPRGATSTYAYQAWDQPSEDTIASIQAPEGVTVSIARDVFGKPLSISRGGVTRRYVYDANQRLCKTLEPETAATVQAYDAAGNLAWRASGLNLPGSGSCDQASVPESRKINHGYDLRNRLTSTSYGDGSPGVTRSYTPDGLPLQVVSGSGFTWTYVYYSRRLLKEEQLTIGGQSPGQGWNFSWGVDAHGNVSSFTDMWSILAYDPDALGQPRQLGGYASGISYHPNGAVAGYTLGNGVSHSVTQNLRGLPELWRDSGPAGTVLQDSYAYDANGNVSAIADAVDGAASRSMGYDGLDRLTQAQGVWGTGSFGYDAQDNLRSSTVGGRSLSHNIDPATNRLASLSGGQTIGFSYDANGNVTQRGSQGFVFDIGNRMVSAPGKAAYYAYDGHGRRIWTYGPNGEWRSRVYTQAGRMIMSTSSTGTLTRYVYLGDKLIAETDGANATTYSHTDALGSPVARTNAAGQLISRTRYEPYGATAAGTNPDGVGFTGHVNDPDTGLVYMQQRYYEPWAGRFLSVDPVTTNAKDGGSFNRYVYANNSPFRYTDPDGRDAFSCAGLVNCTMVGAAAVARAADNVATGGYGQRAGQSFAEGNYGESLLNVGSGVLFGVANAASLGEATALNAVFGVVKVGLPKLGIATMEAVSEGTTVFRIWGGKSGPWGESWTTVNPNTVSNLRSAAGLPDVNTGQFVSEGVLRSTEGVTTRGALVIKQGQQGGLREIVIKESEGKIELRSVSGANPPF